MAWNEQFEPSLDFPTVTAASRRYAICSTPRSGSHFLGQLLFATGVMGCPLEYFHPQNVLRWQERQQAAQAADLLPFLERIRTSPNGCFGAKVHFSHVATLSRHLPLAAFLDSFAHVHITRRDVLAQAISYVRAQQTDQWISRMPASGRTPVYDTDRIRRRLIEVVRQNASWDHLFHSFGVRRLAVEYEELAADPAKIVRDIAAFVGVTLDPNAAAPTPRTARQRDEVSDTWRARFVEEMRRDSTWATLEILQRARPDASPNRSWMRRLLARLPH
jgi:trehalose 2-sulfotransferase